MFDFVASSPFELSVSEGMTVSVVEEDDGSGWVKVADLSSGEKGLVPATYVQMQGSLGTGSGVGGMGGAATRPQGSGKFGEPSSVSFDGMLIRGTVSQVKGLYAYQAQGEDELSVRIGGVIELTPIGGSYADGWSEGIDVDTGKKGIFPSNYVSDLTSSHPGTTDHRHRDAGRASMRASRFPRLAWRQIIITEL